MCVIIKKPAGAHLGLDILKACWNANKDGAGIAWAKEGKVFVAKGFMEWDKFATYIGHDSDWDDMAVLYHFRIKTQGTESEENTHPFEVIPGRLVFAHNGHIKDMESSKHPELSDTAVFNRYVLKQLPQNFLNNTGIQQLIFGTIGSSKLAFLDADGMFTVFNHSMGSEEENGIWFSNTYWKSRLNAAKPTTYGGAAYGSQTYGWGDRNGNRSGYGWGYGYGYQGRGVGLVRRNGFGGYDPLPSHYQSPLSRAIEQEAEEKGDVDDPVFWEENDWYCEGCAQYFSTEDLDDDSWFRRDVTECLPPCPLCGETKDVIDWETWEIIDNVSMGEEEKGASHES